MARILKPQTDLQNSNTLFDRYIAWLDWNIKNIVLSSLWLLFMGIWLAVPAYRAKMNGGGITTPVVIMGAHDTSITASLLWVGILMVACVLFGTVLLVSCIALRLGWLKQQNGNC